MPPGWILWGRGGGKKRGNGSTGAAKDFDDFYELDGDFGGIHFCGLLLVVFSTVTEIGCE